MILNIDVSEDELANALTLDTEYDEIITLVLKMDEIEADSVFTDMLKAAVDAHWLEVHK